MRISDCCHYIIQSLQNGLWQRRQLVLLSLLLSLPHFGFALEPEKKITQYLRKGWTSDDGLISSSTMRVRQAADGYLWVATRDGLSRFDGIRFKNFLPGTTPGYSGVPVRWLLPAKDGSVWAAADNGVSVYRNGHWKSYGTEWGALGSHVMVVAEGKDGIWIGGRNGVGQFRNGHIQPAPWLDQMPSKTVHQLTEDRNGVLWIATLEGLLRVENEKLHLVSEKDGLASRLKPGISAVYEDRSGSIWVGAWGGFLARLKDGKWEHFPMSSWLKIGIPTAPHAITEDHEGNIWVAVYYGGLVRISPNGEVDVLTAQNGLPNEEVYDVSVDREGNVWAAMMNGGGILRLSKNKFTHYGVAEGFPADGINQITQSKDGAMWFATRLSGVVRMKDGKVQTMGKSQGLPLQLVHAILAGRDGSIWLGSSSADVYRYRNGKSRYYTLPVTQASGVRTFMEDREGTLWVGCSSAGLARIVNNQYEAVPLPGGHSTSVHSIVEARDGSILVATAGSGLIRLRSGNATVFEDSINEQLTWVAEGQSGDIWAGSLTGGLLCWRDGKLYRWVQKDGLPDNAIHSFTRFDNGEF